MTGRVLSIVVTVSAFQCKAEEEMRLAPVTGDNEAMEITDELKRKGSSRSDY